MDEPPDTYEVELLVEWQIDMGWGEFMYDSTTYEVALGPSSVAVDSANQYTGSSVCYYGYDRMSTEYLITAHYAHGSTRTMDVPAAVADC